MNVFARVRLSLTDDRDALADYRARIVSLLSGFGAALLMPLVAMHLLAGRGLLAAINMTLCTVLVLNWHFLRRGRPPPVPFTTLGCVLTVCVCTSIYLQGMAGVMWSYPAMFILFFVLPKRLALGLGLALMAGASACAAVSLGLPLAMRYLMSLLLVMTMIMVVLHVIGELQQALVTQAITDPLTGAYNRRHLHVQLSQLVVPGDAQAPKDALLAIDIDHFKMINDRHGHDVGDEVLRRLVATVSARKRRSDMLFRTGGEEFLLLLPRATLAVAQRVAEEIRERLAQAELVPGVAVTVSIGVTALASGQAAGYWVKRADEALYEAKRNGRNRVVTAHVGAAG